MSDRTKQNEYFRSFEHQAGTSSATDGEFANYSPEQIAAMPRRGFLKLMGASMALAGLTLTGCRRWPKEHLVPSTAGQRGQMPGEAEFYATVFERNGVADSLWVKSFDGRPIKIEGNPLHPLFRTADGNPGSMHPDGLGAADTFAQASLLTMYDPYRSRSVLHRSNGNPESSTWDVFVKEFFEKAGTLPEGKGLAILTESTSSLTVAALRDRVLAKYPQAQWATYEPFSSELESEAGKASFGVPARAVYHLDKAGVIVSLDADLFGTHCASTYHSAGWARGRRSVDSDHRMSRLYLAESTMSSTGSAADHRLPVRPSRVSAIAVGLAKALGVSGVGEVTLDATEQAFVDAAAADLKSAKGNGVVAVGGHVAKDTQALVASINASLKSIGNTVTYYELPDDGSAMSAFKQLTSDMRAGSIHALLIIGGNPVYDAPSDLAFESSLKSVPFTAHLSLYDNETSRACAWHLPRSHYLEHWGDARAYDGTVSIQQPLIEPLFDTRSPIQFLAMLAHDDELDGMKLVQRSLGSLTGDETVWKKSLHDGLVPNSSYEKVSSAPKSVSAVASTEPRADSFELRFLPSMTYDGRYADNAWLQEAPDPMTKLVWDNAALMNKNDADRIKVKHGEFVNITLDDKTLKIPVFILWGQPRGVIGLPLGYGRSAATPIGNQVGFNTYVLRRSDSLHADSTGATVAPTGEMYRLVTTQEHHMVQIGDIPGDKGYERRIEGDPKTGTQGQIVREVTMKDYVADPSVISKGLHKLPLVQLYDTPFKREKVHEDAPEAFNYPHAWGMAIDMSICTGCNACTVACQSENNIPVVGKGMVEMNREMHWLRLDRYFKGDADNPKVVFQPMMCVQCENAPCEQVCPVAATVHDTEGLNTMVYNRCIGTRYCSNNCPYKARRFNYFDWHARDPRTGYHGELLSSMWLGIPDTQQVKQVHELAKLRMNPDVSVRMRGVMEKCTYCTQRIKEATIKRKNQWNRGERDHYTVADGDIVTACQQACATQAIVFGDLNDPNSKVSKLMKEKRTYAVLEDLNTRPRTKYMAKITNPSESVAKPQAAPAEAHHG